MLEAARGCLARRHVGSVATGLIGASLRWSVCVGRASDVDDVASRPCVVRRPSALRALRALYALCVCCALWVRLVCA